MLMENLNLVFIGYQKKYALLAAYDTVHDQFKYICKVEAPRFDDDDGDYTIYRDYRVVSNIEPTMWVKPEHIWEIDAIRISYSSTNSCGLSLRQPKFIGYRSDLSINSSTTLSDLRDLYGKQ